MLHAAADELSVAHVAVLVEHPEAVRSALAAAADVLSPEPVRTAAGEASGIEVIVDAESKSVRRTGIGQNVVKEDSTRRKGRTTHLRRVGRAGWAQDPPVRP